MENLTVGDFSGEWTSDVEDTRREKVLTSSISNGVWLINQENCIAVAYDRQGQLVAEDRVVTAGKPAKIRLHAEKTQLESDGQDLPLSLF